MDYNNFLKLERGCHIAEGKQRYIYAHPENPELLIKIPKKIEHKWCNNQPISFLSYHRIFKYYTREFAEDARLRLHFAPNPPDGCIQTIIGLIDTNLGWGMVVRAEKNEYDKYARTVLQLICDRLFEQDKQKQLNLFFQKLADIDICIGDLNLNNIVYSYSLKQGHYFVLIDGLGEKALISLSPFSPAIRRHRRHRAIHKAQATVSQMLKDWPQAQENSIKA